MDKPPPSKPAKPQLEFKTVTFGNREQQRRSVPLRSVSADLPFIVSSPEHRFPNSNTRTYIRRHVMQNHVLKEDKKTAYEVREIRPRTQKSRIEPSEMPASHRRNPGHDLVQQSYEFSVNEVSRLNDSSNDGPLDRRESGPNTPNPKSLLGAGRVDPFETYPIPATWLNHSLLDHFVSVIAPALIPLPFCSTDVFNPLKSIWCRYSLDDPLVFQGILVVASAHIEILTREPSTYEALYYESEITQTVNKRLDDENLALNDSTIGGVTLMAATETIRGNIQKMNMHISALDRMVSFRGGLEKLGMNGLLQMTLSWVDLTVGAIMKTPPRWAHVKCTNSISRELMIAMRKSLRITTQNPTAEVIFISKRDFPTIFHNLQMLSVMLGASRATKHANFSSVYYFCSMRFFLEHCLLSLPPPVLTSFVEKTVDELSRTASLIYLHRVLREFQPQVYVLLVLKEEIMTGFKKAEESAKWMDQGDEYATNLLWTLFCAGTCWLNDYEKSFFAERIAVLVVKLNLKSWQDIETVLLRFLWIKNMCNERVQELWREAKLFANAAPWMEVLNI